MADKPLTSTPARAFGVLARHVFRNPRPTPVAPAGTSGTRYRRTACRCAVAALGFLGVLPGCATPAAVGEPDTGMYAYAEGLRQTWWLQQQLSGLAYPLLSANAELCPDRAASSSASRLGIHWVTLADVETGTPRAAAASIGVSHLPYVAAVASGSPAHRAGLRAGDTLLSVDGAAMPKAGREYYVHVTVMNRTTPAYRRRVDRMFRDAIRAGEPLAIEYRRGETTMVGRIDDALQCAPDVLLIDDRAVASVSARLGGDIRVSWGLLNFVRTDAEIQAVIAHELAHMLQGHHGKAIRNRLIGSVVAGVVMAPLLVPVAMATAADPAVADVVDVVANADRALGDMDEREGRERRSVIGLAIDGAGEALGGMFDRKHEREADRLALYLLERAGIDGQEAIRFWERIPSGSAMADLHGSIDAERLAAMRATLREITAKRASAEPLVP